MEGFSIASLPNSVQTVGPEDIPSRCVASPIDFIVAGSVAASGSEEHTESKHGALSTESISSSFDVCKLDGKCRAALLGWTKAADSLSDTIMHKHAADNFILFSVLLKFRFVQ